MNRLFKTMVMTILFSLFLCQSTWGKEMIKLRLLYDGKMHDYSQEEIHLTVDNKALTDLDMPPISLNGRTYVPVRAIANAIGADVAWQDELGEIYITKSNNIIVFKIDDVKASKNGQPFIMEVPAKVINERTLVPLRGLAEALDCQIEWDSTTRTAVVLTGENESAPPQTIAPTHTAENSNTINNTILESVVNDIQATAIDETDEIIILGNIGVTPVVSRLTEPDRLVIDLPDTMSTLVQNPAAQGLSVVTAIRTGLQEDKTFRIVLDVTPKAGCTITQDKGGLRVLITKSSNEIILPTVSPPTVSPPTVSPPTVSPPTEKTPTVSSGTLKNVIYDSATQILKLKKVTSLETVNIKHHDDYRNATYQLTLPGDYSAEYGTGRLAINDDILTYVDFSSDNGVSTLTFHEKRIRSFWISEDNEYYLINVKDPKAVYPKIVVLDAGHGGNDPGTTGNGIQEKTVALAITQKVYEKLEANNSVKVYFIRADDTNPEKAWRADFANDVGDIFVSVHLNSADTDTAKNPLPNGTEALYRDHALQLGAPLTNKTLATILQKNVVLHLGSSDRGLKYRDDLLILNRSTVPSVIIEIAFLSNPGEALKITQEQNQNLAAEGIYAGIMEALTIMN